MEKANGQEILFLPFQFQINGQFMLKDEVGNIKRTQFFPKLKMLSNFKLCNRFTEVLVYKLDRENYYYYYYFACLCFNKGIQVSNGGTMGVTQCPYLYFFLNQISII